jgi:Lipid desaturase domain
VTTVPGAIMTVLALLGGWLAADLSGAVFHWDKDNYPRGRVGREFIDHHYNPRAVSEWPLRRNVDGIAKPALIGVVAAAFLPGGPLAAFLLSMLNGIIYTQHVHGYSHAIKKDVPKVVRALQGIPLFPVFLSPAEHTRHHRRPLGKEAYGVLNGWSNYITDATQFFRMLEIARERLTGEKPTWEHEKEVRAIAMERKKKGLRSTHDC